MKYFSFLLLCVCLLMVSVTSGYLGYILIITEHYGWAWIPFIISYVPIHVIEKITLKTIDNDNKNKQ